VDCLERSRLVYKASLSHFFLSGSSQGHAGVDSGGKDNSDLKIKSIPETGRGIASRT